MGFKDTLSSMRECIRASLDELASPRSSPSSKTTALKSLERQLATACIVTDASDTKDAFLALQHTFECNIPSHLLPWVTLSTLRLEGLTSRSLAEGERTSEMEELAFQLNLSLSLIQGIVLNHDSSKEHLGRKCSLEILLDLLLASRYLPAKPDPASTNSEAASHPSPPHVTSVVLDTLLCILVDSTTALRTFESAGGVHAVVKILKRFGTPREVRMKCLEFLYFYLLDETPSADSSVSLFVAAAQPARTPPPTAPATPIRPTKPFIAGNTPLRPSSRYGSSTYSFSGSSSPLTKAGNSSTSSSEGSSFASSSARSIPSLVVKTLRSISGSSTHSFSSTSSNASSSTAASSVEGSPSPVKETTTLPSPVFIPPSMAGKKSPIKGFRSTTPQSQYKYLVAPPNSPPIPSSDNGNKVFSAQPRSLMMLRKEVDYVPLSPKKVLVPGIGRPSLVTAVSQPVVGTGSECNRRVHRKSLSVSAAGNGPVPSILQRKRSEAEKMRTPGTPIKRTAQHSTVTAAEEKKVIQGDDKAEKENKRVNWKTLEEKKELLGTMLGNVDALVDGVRKAGVWGLG